MTKNSRNLKQNLRIFLRKHLRRFRRDIQWPLIITLALIALILGYTGFEKYYVLNGLAHSKLDLFYISLKLFMFSNPIEIGQAMPIELEISRFLAPFVFYSTALIALMEILDEQIQFSKLIFIRNHTIVCGLGNKGAHLVKNLNESGEQVIVIEHNERNDLIKTCKDQGVTVLKGDAKDKELLLKAGLNRARYIVSFCGDDTTNIQVAIHSKEVTRNCKGKVLTCIANITNPQISRVLGSLAIEMEKSNCFRVDFFNIYNMGLQKMLKQYPPYADNQSSPHILIVGLGIIGENLLFQIGRNWQSKSEKGKRLRVTIIDKDVETKKNSISSQYPQLEGVFDISTVEADLKSNFYKNKFLNTLRSSDITSVYVCPDKDYLGLSATLLLCRYLRGRNIPIVLQTKQDSGLKDSLSGNDYNNLQLFKLLDSACKPELVLGGVREIFARAIHEEYLNHQKKEGKDSIINPSAVPWEGLSEGLKESNRKQADDIGEKLKAVNCVIIPLNDWDAESFTFSKGEVEKMAEMEHKRWCKERRDEEWKYGPEKNLEKKISPYMVPWDQLSDDIKEYDRVFIRKLPAFLAQNGFEIYRLN